MGKNPAIIIFFILLLSVFVFQQSPYAYPDEEDPGPSKKAAKQLDKAAVRELKTKLRAVRELSRGKDRKQAEALAVYFNDTNSVIRAEAIKGVGKLMKNGVELTPEMVAMLESALSDSSSDVIIQAAGGLQKNASKKSEAKLLSAFKDALKRKDGYDIAVRTAIIQALGTCADRKTGKALKLLAGQMGCGIGLDYDNAVTEALGKIGDPKALKILRTRLDDLLAHEPEEKIAHKPWEEAVALTRAVIAGLEGVKEAENE